MIVRCEHVNTLLTMIKAIHIPSIIVIFCFFLFKIILSFFQMPRNMPKNTRESDISLKNTFMWFFFWIRLIILYISVNIRVHTYYRVRYLFQNIKIIFVLIIAIPLQMSCLRMNGSF